MLWILLIQNTVIAQKAHKYLKKKVGNTNTDEGLNSILLVY